MPRVCPSSGKSSFFKLRCQPDFPLNRPPEFVCGILKKGARIRSSAIDSSGLTGFRHAMFHDRRHREGGMKVLGEAPPFDHASAMSLQVGRTVHGAATHASRRRMSGNSFVLRGPGEDGRGAEIDPGGAD